MIEISQVPMDFAFPVAGTTFISIAFSVVDENEFTLINKNKKKANKTFS